ncbi:MAG TPA: M14 family zinc carboxypeptidase, partial [Nocardioides sp.]|nr:M14 family zinc carboxypeptidase [Nocardioides sp.]
MSPRIPRAGATRLATVTALVAAGLAATAAGATGSAGRDDAPRELARAAADDTTQIVMVKAPTVEQRNEVIGLGLDVTEHADKHGIEVVLHDAQDAQTLRDAGFTWRVTVKDLEALTKKNAKADRAYAASVADSGLPSGRTSYRQYADYLSDMEQLASDYPSLTRPLTLANKTVLGEDIRGIEVTVDADNVKDGKPTFLLMGAHHAREWPSAEHTMEFAFDLLQSYTAGDARARDLLSRSRVILVPVVNVDGFKISRTAAPLGNFSLFDYEMKRKNCRISANTPAAYTTGSCDNNPAGRLRGTDLNRNYPGFWGGGGADPNWSGDTYRGDAPGSEPESDAVRKLISER